MKTIHKKKQQQYSICRYFKIVAKHRIGEWIEWVRVTWQEKVVMDPENQWHYKCSKGWVRKTRKLSREKFDELWRSGPPYCWRSPIDD